MTDSSPPSRPQQVTSAVVLSVGACVLAVVDLFSARDALRSLTPRNPTLEVLVLVSGAVAAAAAVLAVYAWQRNRAARAGFFVLAGVLAFLLVLAGAAGVFSLALLAAGVTFFAGRPARAWFGDGATARTGPQVLLAQDGPSEGVAGPSAPRPGPPPYPGQFGSGGSSAVPSGDRGQEGSGGTGQPAGPPAYGPWHGGVELGKPVDPGVEGQSQPYGTQPYGTQPHGGQPYGTQAYGTQPYGGQPYGAAPGGDPDKRPGTVTAACVLTWVGAALVALLTALAALVLLSDRAGFVREFQQQADLADLRVTADQALAVAWTMTGLVLLWCLVAAVVAVLAFRRSRGGRVGLAVSAGLTVLVSLLAILSIVAAVPLLMGIAVLVLLFTGGANDWYARRPRWSPPGGGPGGPYGGQPAYGQQPPPPPGRPGPW